MIHKINMDSHGLAIARCALAYAEPFLPNVSHLVSKLGRQILLAYDFFSLRCIGSQIKDKLYEHRMQREGQVDSQQFHIDCAVKAVAVLALAAIFVQAVNKISNPSKLDLSQLLKNSDKSVTARWVKPLLENLSTGVLFTHTILDLYLAYLTSTSKPLFQALIHALTTFKASQYRTLELKRSFEYLFQKIHIFYSPDPLYPKQSEYFHLPIKKVEAIFQVNVSGLSQSSLTEKVQTVYDYSKEMFDKSVWNRYWSIDAHLGYFRRVVPSVDQELTVSDKFLTNWQIKLIYNISIHNSHPLPAPVEVRILHEDQLWQPFQGVEVLRWIPRFFVPAQKVPYAAWITAELTVPMTRFETVFETVFESMRKILLAGLGIPI